MLRRNSRTPSTNRPADLGYYSGFKIAESYYDNLYDKLHATKEIMEMSDSMEFLELSGYDAKFQQERLTH